MRDFTLEMYKHLLTQFRKAGYTFQSLEDFIGHPLKKVVILRHDIDARPHKALEFCAIEKELKIRSTYYFRIGKISFNPLIIKKVVSYGNELGYHYEDLTASKGVPRLAISRFKKNLTVFRTFYNVKTISMHGRALSIYDNRDLWKSYDYRDFGIIAEPYLDIDFNKVLYLTDSAQCWNGGKATLRDRVVSNFTFSFRTTNDIIEGLMGLPDKVMLTVHPDRWARNNFELWWLRLIISIRNFAKIVYFNRRAIRFMKSKSEGRL